MEEVVIKNKKVKLYDGIINLINFNSKGRE